MKLLEAVFIRLAPKTTTCELSAELERGSRLRWGVRARCKPGGGAPSVTLPRARPGRRPQQRGPTARGVPAAPAPAPRGPGAARGRPGHSPALGAGHYSQPRSAPVVPPAGGPRCPRLLRIAPRLGHEHHRHGQRASRRRPKALRRRRAGPRRAARSALAAPPRGGPATARGRPEPEPPQTGWARPGGPCAARTTDAAPRSP